MFGVLLGALTPADDLHSGTGPESLIHIDLHLVVVALVYTLLNRRPEPCQQFDDKLRYPLKYCELCSEDDSFLVHEEEEVLGCMG